MVRDLYVSWKYASIDFLLFQPKSTFQAAFPGSAAASAFLFRSKAAPQKELGSASGIAHLPSPGAIAVPGEENIPWCAHTFPPAYPHATIDIIVAPAKGQFVLQIVKPGKENIPWCAHADLAILLIRFYKHHM